jgi:hypothetical protein
MGLLDDAIREHLDLKRRRGADPAEIERAEREALGPVRREPSMSAAVAEDPLGAGPGADARSEDFAFAPEPGDFGAEPPTTVAAPGGVDPFEDDAPAGIAAPHYEDPAFDEFAAAETTVGTAPDPQPAALDELEGAPFEPAEPEPKPKRRHLFGRHRHEDEDERSPLPAELPDDDPFAEAPAVEPVETGDGEAVGRAQPIAREVPPAAQTPPPILLITPEGEAGNTIEYDVEQAFREEDGGDESEAASTPPEDEDILEETPDFLADTPDHDRLWFEQKPPPDFDFDD